MSELREECYKCLNNQSCISGADYGSMYCMLHRKYKMQGDNEDSIYAIKFAAMQEQIKEKDKRIAELEEENMQKGLEIIGAKEYTEDNMRQIIEKYYTANEDSIPKQKVKDRIEELQNDLKLIACNKDCNKCFSKEGKALYRGSNFTFCYAYHQIKILQELLEDK